MNKKLLLFLVIFNLPDALAEAAEGDNEYRVLKEMHLGKDAKAVVLVKQGGHLIGQPFQVELRASCKRSTKDFLKWPVQDSFSVCDLSPESLKINSKQSAVAMKTKSADLVDYDNQMDAGSKHPLMKCQKKTKIRKFSLKNLCHSH